MVDSGFIAMSMKSFCENTTQWLGKANFPLRIHPLPTAFRLLPLHQHGVLP